MDNDTLTTKMNRRKLNAEHIRRCRHAKHGLSHIFQQDKDHGSMNFKISLATNITDGEITVGDRFLERTIPNFH